MENNYRQIKCVGCPCRDRLWHIFAELGDNPLIGFFNLKIIQNFKFLQ